MLEKMPSHLSAEAFVPPVVNNLLFVKSTFEAIDSYRRFNADGERIGFMRDTLSREPLIVRDAAMEMFMKVCSASALPIVMNEKPDLKVGAHVRVKDGPFKGVEGHVVRIKKSRRILVEIPGVLWAATEFVSPELLEQID